MIRSLFTFAFIAIFPILLYGDRPSKTPSVTFATQGQQQQAEEWYQQAVRLTEGAGVPQNYASAAALYKKAAEYGHVGAEYNLGYMYENGLGLKTDLNQAVVWYRKAADQGDAQAQNNLGALYATGRGVHRDDAQAAHYYGLAAAQNDPEANSNLGMMYLEGRSVRQDDHQAFVLIRKAAGMAYPIAENNLGLLYANGQGTERNYILAWAWFDVAAASISGSADIRDRLAKEMTEEDVRQAKETATQLREALAAFSTTEPSVATK